MADLAFNTSTNATIERELLLCYLNTGTGSSATWSPLGKRVAESAEEIDWGAETSRDVLGNTYTELKKPVITQTFEPWNITKGDAAAEYLWNKAIREQDYSALASCELLIVHCYAGTSGTAMFAEKYDACAIAATGLGGAGGGAISMPIGVTYGGNRVVGTAAISSGTVTFTAET